MRGSTRACPHPRPAEAPARNRLEPALRRRCPGCRETPGSGCCRPDPGDRTGVRCTWPRQPRRARRLRALSPRRGAEYAARAAKALLLRFEHVARLPDRPDQRWPERVEFLAQVAHVRLDDVGVAGEFVVPDVLQDLTLREHAARVEEE